MLGETGFGGKKQPAEGRRLARLTDASVGTLPGAVPWMF